MPQPAPRADRRRVLRLMAGASLALVAAAPLREAAAGRKWCRRDPVVMIGRGQSAQTAHVYVSALVRNQQEARRLSTGPIKLAVHVPLGCDARLLGKGDNAYGAGYEMEVVEAEDLEATDEVVPVRIEVLVPMRRDVEVRAEFSPTGQGPLRPGKGEGKANVPISFTAG